MAEDTTTLVAFMPWGVVSSAVFIETYNDKGLTLEISVLTEVRMTETEAEFIRRWAIDEHQEEIVAFGEMVQMYTRAETLPIWVNVGLYHREANNSTNG
jgi:hypothetical protein